jgi:hypothetical protein
MAAFSPPAEEEEKKPLDRRLLLIVQFADNTYVLQGVDKIHQPKHCFRTEAEAVFKKAFTFVLKDYVFVGKTFQRNHVEWHPIIFPLAQYSINSLLDGEKTDLTGLEVQKIAEHPLYQQLLAYDHKPATV